jgi:hypothetical protein
MAKRVLTTTMARRKRGFIIFASALRVIRR